MAVLVGVLAPNLIRYIEKAKLARANYNARVVYEYALEYITECDLRGNTNIFQLSGRRAMPMTAYDGQAINYNGFDTEDLFNYLKMCYGSNETKDNKANYVVVYFNDDYTLKYVTWAANQSDTMVGCYPTPAVGRSSKKYARLYYVPNLGDQ